MNVHREAFEEFAELVVEELGDELDRLVLHGSVVRGEARDDSDVDVLVVLNSESRVLKDKVLDIAFDVTLDKEVHVSPVIVSKKEFERVASQGSKFLETVEREGETVYG